jgi:hypothetical protein
MHQQNLVITTALVGLITMSCAPSVVPRLPSPLPGPEDPAVSTVPPVTSLTFSPGSYRYHLRQTAEIIAQESGNTAAPSTITTTAVFYVEITRQSDSLLLAVISVDSLRITSQGLIPQTRSGQGARLDSIFQAVLSPTLITSQGQLPDSLCQYGQLVSTARLILLPELAFEPAIPSRRVYGDTTREVSCHAGARLETLTTRQLRNSAKEPTEFSIEQQADLQGTGVLRQDSVVISGSIRTQGTASFPTGGRLPSSILTSSDGTITVQLGITKTVFRQQLNQEIRQETP